MPSMGGPRASARSAASKKLNTVRVRKVARAADLVDSHQVVKQAFGDFLSIMTILKDAIGVGDGADRRLSGWFSLRIVASNESAPSSFRFPVIKTNPLADRFAKSANPARFKVVPKQESSPRTIPGLSKSRARCRTPTPPRWSYAVFQY